MTCEYHVPVFSLCVGDDDDDDDTFFLLCFDKYSSNKMCVVMCVCVLCDVFSGKECVVMRVSCVYAFFTTGVARNVVYWAKQSGFFFMMERQKFKILTKKSKKYNVY